MTNNIEDLRWIRVFTPFVIPRYLVEQIRDKDYSVDDFYKYLEIGCLRETEEGQTLNPFFHVYVLVGKDNITRGFLWFTIDPLSKDVCIQVYSVDKEYWNHGKAVKFLAEHVKEIVKKASLNKVFWITRYPKHSERYGFKKSDSILMEYDEKSTIEKQEIGIKNK